jgi:hypothetical protein
LVAAFATLYPERPLTLLLFFIIPISMRAKVLLWGALGLSIFGIIVPVGRVAHAAHLGGLLAGIGFIYWLVRGHELGGWNLLPRREQRPRRLVRTASERESFWRRPKKPWRKTCLRPSSSAVKSIPFWKRSRRMGFRA